MKKTDYTKVYLMGEVQDDYSPLAFLDEAKDDNCQLIIHTGNLFKNIRNTTDFDRLMTNLNSYLTFMDYRMIVLRGCKDDIRFFDKPYGRIEMVKYKAITPDRQILLLAGGINPGERDEDNICEQEYKFSPHIVSDFKFVVSHIPPYPLFDFATHKEYLKSDAERLESIRMYYTYKLIKQINKNNNKSLPLMWFFGKYNEELQVEDCDTIFKGVKLNDFKKLL